MSSYQTVYKNGSYDILNFTLQKVDIYHCSQLPVHVVQSEVLGFAKNKSRKLSEFRYDWVYGQTGLFNSLINHSNFVSRLVALYSEGDKPYTARHRVNITNTLLDVNFDTNLPLHVSIGRNDTFELNPELDIENLTKGYRVIIHPGHTRAVGSLFLNSPIKNSLIYINKSFSEKLTVKEYPYLTKIETPDELVKHYRPLREPSSDKLVYDFFLGGSSHDIVDGKKIHVQNNTPILKASSIKSENSKSAKNLHSSPSYIDETFRSYNNLLNLIVGKNINVYTDIGEKGNSLEVTKRSDLFNRSFNANILLKENTSEYRNPNKPYRSIIDDSFVRFTNSISTFSKNELELYKVLNQVYRENFDRVSQDYEEFRPAGIFTYVDIYPGISPKEVALNCKYKGLAFIINDHNNIKRLLLEYLLCINKDVALSKLENESIVIVNCEHPYWKEEGEYNEWVIPAEFEEI